MSTSGDLASSVPPSPQVQCCCGIERCFVSFVCLPSHVVPSQHHPILNQEGCGEARALLLIVSVLLVCFGGAIFCPSTVKITPFFVYACAFEDEIVTLR